MRGLFSGLLKARRAKAGVMIQQHAHVHGKPPKDEIGALVSGGAMNHVKPC